jgi:hypothetical protein
MNKFKKLFAGLVIAGTIVGCGDTSTNIVPQAKDSKDGVSEKPKDVQTFKPKVDILFVIDNSGSMGAVQANLSANAKVFADEIAKMTLLDFHIGVITTDMQSYYQSGKLQSDGREPVFLERTTPNLPMVLKNRILVGTGGSAYEKMFEPVIKALSPPLVNTTNLDFYRDDAYLAMIFVTDAMDQSNTITTQQFYNFLVGKKKDYEKVLGYGVIRSQMNARACPTEEELDGKLEGFLNMVTTGGLGQPNILSLCAPKYGQRLIEFAKDIVKRAAGTIRLNRVPDPSTIRVKYGKQEIPNSYDSGWVYENSTNSILLSPNILWETQEGAELSVDFEAFGTDL